MNKKVAFLLPFSFATSALVCSAVILNFEGPTYSTGHLNGQDGWSRATSNTGSIINVVSTGPLAGSRSIASSEGATDHVYYKRNFSNAELGTTFNGNASVVSFDFLFQLTETPIPETGNGTHNFKFSLTNDGTVNAADGYFAFAVSETGRLLTNVSNASTTDVFEDSLFSTGVTAKITGSVDLANETWVLSVDSTNNGTDNYTVSGTTASDVNPAYLSLYIANLNANKTNHLNWKMDNLNISAVPEPASYALLLGALTLGIAVRQRKRG